MGQGLSSDMESWFINLLAEI